MIYLINPSEKGILTNYGDRPPLGLLSIATFLRTKGIQSKIYDLNHLSLELLKEDITKEKPEHVGISMFTTSMYERTKNITNIIRELSPETKISIGGYHPTVLPETISFADYVVMGEGEIAMWQIVTNQVNKGLIQAIPPDLNHLPAIDRSFVDMNKYNMIINNKRTATIITSRGCPYSCIYCGKMSRNVRFSPIKIIEKEIDELIYKYGYKNLYFLDDVFTINRSRTKELTSLLRNKDVTYRVTTRVDLIDQEIIQMLANSGCETISFGIESGSNKVLKSANKQFTKDIARNAVELAGKHDINVKGFFMFGLPNETMEDAYETMEFAVELKQLGMTTADFYIMTPFPGTAIFINPDKYGIKIFKPTEWSSYLETKDGEPISKIDTRHLTRDDLKELINLAKRKFANGG